MTDSYHETKKKSCEETEGCAKTKESKKTREETI